jgi:hypothetical protein
MLKYNIRKRKLWVHPFFRDNLNPSAYIVSKELNQDPVSFASWEILSQAKSILSCLHGICHIYQVPVQLTAQKQNWQLHQPFVPWKETNESQKHVRTADTRKLRGNATVRRLAYTVAWELSFSVFRELRCNCVAVSSISASPFSSTGSTQSNNNSRKLRLSVSMVCPLPYTHSLY